jgi:hypothetical protein
MTTCLSRNNNKKSRMNGLHVHKSPEAKLRWLTGPTPQHGAGGEPQTCRTSQRNTQTYIHGRNGMLPNSYPGRSLPITTTEYAGYPLDTVPTLPLRATAAFFFFGNTMKTEFKKRDRIEEWRHTQTTEEQIQHQHQPNSTPLGNDTSTRPTRRLHVAFPVLGEKTKAK